MHIFTRTAHNSLEKRETHKSCLKINKLHEWQKNGFSFSFVTEQFGNRHAFDVFHVNLIFLKNE